MNNYYSQYGQDKLLNSIINKHNGIFIDIGAHDGITYNNSYFFEKELNWKGICIEPLPTVFKQLQSIRNCILENCAISNIEGDLDFVAAEGYAEMLSGFNREQVIKETIAVHGGSYNVIKVPTYRLDTILNKHNINEVDFCSIDAEGNEINIVKSIDWTKYKIDYLCIEANIGIEKVIEYLSPWYTKYATIVGDIILQRYY